MRRSTESSQADYMMITAGVLVIILFGSLFPFDFYANPNPAGSFSALISTYDTPGGRGDLIANVLLYVPLGFFALLASSRRPRLRQVLLVIVAGLMVSTTIELIQFYDRGRFSSLWDVYANVAGTALGAVSGVVLFSRFRLPAIGNSQQHPFVFLLLACWLGYRLFPYAPTTDLHKYWHALKPLLFTPRLTGLALYRHTVNWLAIAVLFEALVGVAHSRLVFTLFIPTVLFTRILVVDIALSPAEVIGGILAALAWVGPLSRLRTGVILITLLFVGTVVAQSLDPFHFSATARVFGWIPFRGFMLGSLAVNIPSFLEKGFTYGSLTWLLVRSGCTLRIATLLGSLLVLCLQLAQVYLPGRSAEITDVLMVVILSGMMKLMSEDPSGPRRRP